MRSGVVKDYRKPKQERRLKLLFTPTSKKRTNIEYSFVAKEFLNE